MKNFSEKKFLSLVSIILRYGVMSFIMLSVISYFLKPLSELIYRKILNIAVFMLIITPIIRIVMLSYGFYRLNERKYSFYTFTILVLLFIGILVK